MERNIIVYFGMGFLPDNNAVACREQVFSFITKEIGYTPVLIGINSEVHFNSYKKYIQNDVCCYDIKYAKTLTEKFKDIYAIKKTIISIFEDIGVEKIKCFIMQDYQFEPMRYFRKYCNANGIAFVADIMDWIVPSRYCSIAKNISKSIDTVIRMHWFYRHLNNRIYISHKFEEFFNDKKNTIVFPSTCKDIEVDFSTGFAENDNITISFTGGLAENSAKEKLDWIIRALYENKSSINLNVVGVTREQFLLRFPKFAKFITSRIHFYGYVPHNECVKILKNSDFSAVIRKNNKLTKYGFSNKICESFVNGVPVLATDNSDNKIYIKDGVNGYVCEANYNSLKNLLAEVEKFDKESIYIMHQELGKINPLSAVNYIEGFSKFINDLII